MAITFKSLSYIYDEGMPYAHHALKDINLNIEEGKITAIIGKTGSGKSTLVEHLNALLVPSSGSLEIEDTIILPGKKNKGLKALRKKVGLVFQFSEYQLFEETILKDVAFGPKNYGASEQEAIAKAKLALKMVGIDESYYETSPFDLSGGQKRRIAIAGILALEPKIIVLDEPTAGLDPKGSQEMIDLFVKLNKKAGITVILVTHDNEIVYNYADNTVLMADGEVKYSGNTLELFNDKEKVKKFNILEPKILSVKNALNDKGFKIPSNVRTIDELAKYLSKELRK
ncbi:MAG: energy-coupling factor transporter ATPase [Solobacterium sp.]|nr:energy-coupling factor transporter ATPase [Solobacterium sp.]MDY2953153.1 energy-coupling factor transporter ATPase [Erysipelotrichaceae bacterium]MCI7156445.1 energy-coupling factor transporter ATPase [Solobacterium sp.]MCI7444811.1 energy-coupling factor transporter ATPase [Solobacterium sp.]MDY3794470.1 energy-coupling factor transporter ATPase [Erysipelotrichaceae bacterium]